MILFVDQTGQLGGAELCLADIAEDFRPEARVVLFGRGPFEDHLRARGLPVEVIELEGAAARATKAATPGRMLAGLPALVRQTLRLRRAMRGARLVYANTAKALLLCAAAGGLRPKIPLIFHLHDLWDEGHFSRSNIRLLVAASHRARTIICNSRATEAAFRAAGGRQPCVVIPNGFDPSVFDRVSDAEAARARRDLGGGEALVAAVFGRVSPWKGQEVAVQAVQRLPGVILWIVGRAVFTEEDRAYEDLLRRQAELSGGKIRLAGFRDDVPVLMRAADVVVHCSTEAEPFGRVVVEAMLARRPVVAAAAGGPAEIIEDGRTGLLVPPGDSASLAAALRRLQADPDLCQRLGEAGRMRAVDRFSLPLVLRKTRHVIESALQV